MGIKLTNSRELQALVLNEHLSERTKNRRKNTSEVPSQQKDVINPSQPQLDLMEIFNDLN